MTEVEKEWSEETLLRLTSPEDIERACRELCAREAATRAELRAWVAQPRPPATTAVLAQAAAPLAPAHTPDVAALAQSLDALCDASEAPAAVARRVAGTVRAVATVAARTRSAAARVQELIDLGHSLRAAEAARARGDLAAAAHGVQRYLAIDAAVLDAPSRRLLAATRAELLRALGDRVDAVVAHVQSLDEEASGHAAGTSRTAATSTTSTSKEEQEEQVRELCALYGALGAEDEGLARYTQFVRARIEAAADAVFADLAGVRAEGAEGGAGDLAAFEADGGSGSGRGGAGARTGVVSFGAGLTRVCEAIADTVQRLVHSDDAARPLWPGSALPLLCEVQSLSDALGSRLCDMFYSCFSVTQRVCLFLLLHF